MNPFKNIFFCCFILLFLFACKKEDEITGQPGISNVTISKDTLQQGTTIFDDHFIFSFTLFNASGKSGFATPSDSLYLTFYDLRFSNSPPMTYYIADPPNSPIFEVMGGEIKVEVQTTCCAFTMANPCEPAPGVYEPVAYEVQYLNNFGLDLPRDTIHFILDCSF